MKNGATHELTRQRGGLADNRAFEQHYARLHQVYNWEDALRGVTPHLAASKQPLWNTLEDASVSAEWLGRKVPGHESRNQDDLSGTDLTDHEALTLLHAKGLLRELGDDTRCGVCGDRVGLEAGWVCASFQPPHLVHVRCLAWVQVDPSLPPHKRSTNNEVCFMPTCARCAGATVVTAALGHEASSSSAVDRNSPPSPSSP